MTLPPPPDSIPKDWHAEEEREARTPRWMTMVSRIVSVLFWVGLVWALIWQTGAFR